MGQSGTVPKRSTERRRRNKTNKYGESLVPDRVKLQEFDGEVVDAPEPNPNWHPAAMTIWTAACESGQRIFWEPSDWAVLALTCSQISQLYRDDFVIEKVKQPIEGGSGGGEELVYGSRPMTGQEFSAILKAFSSLGMSEGDRRRMRIELERGQKRTEPPTVEGVVDARSRFLGGETG